MGLLQDKLAKYDLPQQYMAMGVYPYFRTIDSHQLLDVPVLINRAPAVQEFFGPLAGAAFGVFYKQHR